MTGALGAQEPITRADAVQRALAASARIAAISADTAAAAARLRSARAYPNPTITAAYSKSVPQNHLSLDVPLDLPPVRGARVRAAEAARASARFTFLADRAAIELEVDTMYTTAQGAALRAALSRATAVDAAALLRATRARRDAGDASDLEVNLAEVSAQQAANTAAADSLEEIDTLLELQTAMGVRGDTIVFVLRDSLTAPGTATMRVTAIGGAVPPTGALAAAPRVAAASASLTSAQEALALQRRSVFGAPAITLGVEGRDPTGGERGVLPTFGIALPLPLFNRNQGEIAAARADVQRAQAELATARLEASSQLARAYRTRAAAESRLARDEAIVTASSRNATLAARAYSVGEMAIGDVLEARRAQREAQAQLVSDLVAANVGAALVRVLTSNGVTP
jgi:cobalt-zinc-cadmium efflux system outer membrane protein